jgi:hypothetical protein
VSVGSRGRVDGAGSGGVLYAQSTGVPSVAGELRGAPPSGALPDYDGSVEAVFGVSLDDLKGMATVRTPGTVPLPQPLPDNALVVVEGDLVVTPAAPLRGHGVLVVDGDLTVPANTNSYFTGVVYVTGNYVQRAPSLVRGAVVVQGTASVSGLGDHAELTYDAGIVTALMREVGRYRFSRALHRTDRDPWGTGR